MINNPLTQEQNHYLAKKICYLVAGLFSLNILISSCAPGKLSNMNIEKNSPKPISKNQASIVEFSDIPMPKSREINLDKTMVVGTNVWFGRLTFDTGRSGEEMFLFYTRELKNYGWKKITAVRAQTSLMTYEHESRILSIAIKDNPLHGSEVGITMSPKEQSIFPASSTPSINATTLPSPSKPR